MGRDDAAYEELCREHAAALGRVAYLLTGDRELARDLAQEALLDAYRRFDRVRAADDRWAYLRRVLVNRHLSGHRRHRVREVLTDAPPERGGDAPDLVAERDALWRALADLSERQRAVLVLRHYEGLDDDAIATALGVGRSTVRSLATRGLAALRESPHVRVSAPGRTP